MYSAEEREKMQQILVERKQERIRVRQLIRELQQKNGIRTKPVKEVQYKLPTLE